jgi:hypothetical protein
VAIGRTEKGEILTRVVESVRRQEGVTGFLKQGACTMKLAGHAWL